MAKFVLMVFAFALLSSASSFSQSVSAIPNASMSVTVQQKEGGRLDKGYHVLELGCWNGECTLTSISLNQCGPSGSGVPAFYPKVQRTSTREDNLKVSKQGNVLIVRETGSDIGGDYVNNFRFEYQPVPKDKTILRLVGFTGGFVKNSNILKRVITVDYIPLQGAYLVKSLDCGVLVPGVDSVR